MTRRITKAEYDWLVPDQEMAHYILRACANHVFARRYFSNATINGFEPEAVTNTLQYISLKQKLAWMGSAYLGEALIRSGQLAGKALANERARAQRQRNRYNSLVRNVRKAFAMKRNCAPKYEEALRAFNEEGQTSIRRVYLIKDDYTSTTYEILRHLGELEDSS